MKRKRILFFVEKLYGGGVEKIARIILRNFDYERYDVTLYTLCQDNISNYEFSGNIKYKFIFHSVDGNTNIRNILLKCGNKLKLSVYYHLSPKLFSRIFVGGKYDVGIAFIEGYATRIISGMSIKNKVAWVHTDMIRNRWTQVAYRHPKEEIECYSKYHKIACVSTKVDEIISRLLPDNICHSVIHNPIDVDEIIRKSLDKYVDYYRYRDSIHIMSLGSLIPVKAYDRLIDVIRRLNDEGINCELLILGEGKMRKSLEEKIVRSGLHDKVHLPGFVSNPYPYLKAADIYVCSSVAEGFNTSITEGIILGKPIVSTDCAGVSEQLGENNEYGIRTENSSDGIFEGLLRMCDPQVRKSYSERALQSAGRFNLKCCMKQFYAFIDS